MTLRKKDIQTIIRSKNVLVDGKFDTKAIIDDERLNYTKEWLDDYLESLRAQGYDYNFFPMFTKGILVDNAPPNPHIMEAIKRFNELHGDIYEFEMIGINFTTNLSYK